MLIQEALKQAGESEGKILNVQMNRVAQPDQFGILRWLDEGTLVMVIDITEGEWQPYHEVKEIRPEKAGELWEHKDGIFAIAMGRDGRLGRVWVNQKPSFANPDNMLSVYTQPMKEVIHGKDSYKRLFPPIEDDSVERMVFENVTFRNKNGCIVAMNECGAMIGVLDSPPMKMTLEKPKNCSHGKGLNDYCEPCGRINGG